MLLRDPVETRPITARFPADGADEREVMLRAADTEVVEREDVPIETPVRGAVRGTPDTRETLGALGALKVRAADGTAPRTVETCGAPGEKLRGIIAAAAGALRSGVTEPAGFADRATVE
jgi:hypothetical protein